MNTQVKQRGFSIIEVVLVLAIAGLIFLMVFIALPALQRSQRDSARQQEVQTVVGAIGTYASSNNGNLPTKADQISSIVEGNTSGVLKSGTKINVYSAANLTAPYTVTGSTTATTNTATTLIRDNIAIYSGKKCSTANVTSSVTLVPGTTRQAAVLSFLEGNVIYCSQY